MNLSRKALSGELVVVVAAMVGAAERKVMRK